MMPSVSVPSTSRNNRRIGGPSGAPDATRGLQNRLAHAQRLVQERGGASERQLRLAVRERALGVGVRLEEQTVDAARDRGAHQRERELALSARLLAAGLLQAVRG